MANIFSLYGEIFIDNEKANKQISDTTEKAKKSSISFKDIGAAVVKVGKTAAVAFTGIATAATAMVEGTKEYRTAMGGLETAFTSNGLSANLAKQSYQELYGVLGDTGKASEASRFLGLMADNEKELAEWTNAATGVYAVFGDTLPIEGLTEAANETAKVGKVTGTLADALNWVGISEDEFNLKLERCASESEREQLIRETLNKTYSEAADTYKNLNGELIKNNKAQAQIQDTTAQIGATVEPIITMGKQLLADVLTQIGPTITQMMTLLMPPIMQFIQMAMPFLTQLIDVLLPFLVQIMTTLSPFIMQIVNTILPVLMNLLQMLLPPLMQIINILLPLLLSLIEPILPLLQPIFDLLQPFIDLLMEIISPLAEILNQILPPLIEILSNIFKSILPSLKNALTLVSSVISNVLGGALGFIKDQFDVVINVFKNIINFIKNVFTGNWKSAWENIKNIFSNIAKGLGNIFKAPINFIIDAINGFIKGLNKIKIPDWVPLVGGKGFNINLIKKLRVGMDYVPYDEYPAILHKGEAVLTADENKEYQNSKKQIEKQEIPNIIYNNNITIEKMEVRDDHDIESIAEELYYLQKREVGA